MTREQKKRFEKELCRGQFCYNPCEYCGWNSGPREDVLVDRRTGKKRLVTLAGRCTHPFSGRYSRSRTYWEVKKVDENNREYREFLVNFKPKNPDFYFAIGKPKWLEQYREITGFYKQGELF